MMDMILPYIISFGFTFISVLCWINLWITIHSIEVEPWCYTKALRRIERKR